MRILLNKKQDIILSSLQNHIEILHLTKKLLEYFENYLTSKWFTNIKYNLQQYLY